jgi:hypothetical protein
MCIRINGYGFIGYVMRVTLKYVSFVCEANIFRKPFDIQMAKNAYVKHVHPYVGNVVVDGPHCHVWNSMTRELLDCG